MFYAMGQKLELALRMCISAVRRHINWNEQREIRTRIHASNEPDWFQKKAFIQAATVLASYNFALLHDH